jgi:hypothetical protein
MGSADVFMGIWSSLLLLFVFFVFPDLWYSFILSLPFVKKIFAADPEPMGWLDLGGFLLFFYLLLRVLALRNAKIDNILYKQSVFFFGVLGMVFSRDFKWKKTPEPGRIRGAKEKAVKRIVFIRHGESDWNEVFNRGFGPSFFVRLARAVWREVRLLPTRDSLFVDASLSHEGLEQIEHLHEFLADADDPSGDNAELIAILRGDRDVDKSILVASNLRRAIATALIGLQHRLKRTGEPIYIMSSLQEISRNVDANAISKTQEIPDLGPITEELFSGFVPEKYLDPSMNFGQKHLVFSNGFKRMREFSEWAFSQPKETIIVGGGHSFYFRGLTICLREREK